MITFFKRKGNFQSSTEPAGNAGWEEVEGGWDRDTPLFPTLKSRSS